MSRPLDKFIVLFVNPFHQYFHSRKQSLQSHKGTNPTNRFGKVDISKRILNAAKSTTARGAAQPATRLDHIATSLTLPGGQSLTSAIHDSAQKALQSLSQGQLTFNSLTFEAYNLTEELISAGRKAKFDVYALAANQTKMQTLLDGFVLSQYIEAARSKAETLTITFTHPEGEGKAKSKDSNQSVTLGSIQDFTSIKNEQIKTCIRVALLMRELQGEKNGGIEGVLSHLRKPLEEGQPMQQLEGEALIFADLINSLSDWNLPLVADNLARAISYNQDPVSKLIKRVDQEYYSSAPKFAQDSGTLNLASMSELQELVEIINIGLEAQGIQQLNQAANIFLTKASIDVPVSVFTKKSRNDIGSSLPSTLTLQGVVLPTEAPEPEQQTTGERKRKQSPKTSSSGRPGSGIQGTLRGHYVELPPDEQETILAIIKDLGNFFRQLPPSLLAKTIINTAHEALTKANDQGCIQMLQKSLELLPLNQRNQARTILTRLTTFTETVKARQASEQAATEAASTKTAATQTPATASPPTTETQTLDLSKLPKADTPEYTHFWGRFGTEWLKGAVEYLEADNEAALQIMLNPHHTKTLLSSFGVALPELTDGPKLLRELGKAEIKVDETTKTTAKEILLTEMKAVIQTRAAKAEQEAQQAIAKAAAKAAKRAKPATQPSLKDRKAKASPPSSNTTTGATQKTTPGAATGAGLTTAGLASADTGKTLSQTKAPVQSAAQKALGNISPLFAASSFRHYLELKAADLIPETQIEAPILDLAKAFGITPQMPEDAPESFFIPNGINWQRAIYLKRQIEKQNKQSKTPQAYYLLQEPTAEEIEKFACFYNWQDNEVAFLTSMQRIESHEEFNPALRAFFEPLPEATIQGFSEHAAMLATTNQLQTMRAWAKEAAKGQFTKEQLIELIKLLEAENQRLKSSNQSLEINLSYVPNILEKIKNLNLAQAELTDLSEEDLKTLLNGFAYNFEHFEVMIQVVRESVQATENKQPANALNKYPLHPSLIPGVLSQSWESLVQVLVPGLSKNPQYIKDGITLADYLNLEENGDFIYLDKAPSSGLHDVMPVTLMQYLEVMLTSSNNFKRNVEFQPYPGTIDPGEENANLYHSMMTNLLDLSIKQKDSPTYFCKRLNKYLKAEAEWREHFHEQSPSQKSANLNTKQQETETLLTQVIEADAHSIFPQSMHTRLEAYFQFAPNPPPPKLLIRFSQALKEIYQQFPERIEEQSKTNLASALLEIIHKTDDPNAVYAAFEAIHGTYRQHQATLNGFMANKTLQEIKIKRIQLQTSPTTTDEDLDPVNRIQEMRFYDILLQAKSANWEDLAPIEAIQQLNQSRLKAFNLDFVCIALTKKITGIVKPASQKKLKGLNTQQPAIALNHPSYNDSTKRQSLGRTMEFLAAFGFYSNPLQNNEIVLDWFNPQGQYEIVYYTTP